MTQRYDTYKDSGVQWLGEIPGHWGCVPFKSVFELGKGLSITKGDLKDSGVKVISYGQIHSKNNKFSYVVPELYRFVDETYLTTNPQSLANKEDFLFADTSEDTVGSGNFVRIDNEETTFAGYHTIIARNKKVQSGNYLAYLLQSKKWKMQIWVQVHGVKLFSITRSILNSTKLLLPPLSEQRSIVSFLDAKCGKIDEWVTKKQKEVEHLQELKQRVIADAVTRGLNPHVKMKATNIPWIKEIPEHWEIKRSKYLLKLLTESTKRIRKIGLENIESNTGKFILTKTIFDGDGVDFDCGDILYGKLRPYLNKVWLAEFDGNAVGDFYVYRAINGYFNSFAKYLLMSSCFVGISNASTYGAKMPRVSSQFIHSLHFPVPHLSEQKQIVSYLDAKTSKIDKLIANITKEIDCIKEYKQRLISDVVTGQIKVC